MIIRFALAVLSVLLSCCLLLLSVTAVWLGIVLIVAVCR
jgi:hypothetical protein